MHPQFAEFTPRWFKRAFVYTGSIGEFSQLCYELARDIEEQDFPWDDDGVKQLQSWLQSRYEAYCAAHSA